MPYDEESIEQRLLRGDLEALALASRWIAGVLTSARFWALRSEWADLQQEVLLRVIQSLRQERFDANRDFRVYVQGIARYAALTALAVRTGVHAEEVSEAQSPTADSYVISGQLVRRALERASEECRALMRAYFLAERSYEEIATSRGIPVGTVKSRLFRCLESAYRHVARGRRSRRSVDG